jgi:hypothetical protein
VEENGGNYGYGYGYESDSGNDYHCDYDSVYGRVYGWDLHLRKWCFHSNGFGQIL